MSRQRSILLLIVLPAVVSLAVTLLVLYLWDRQQEPEVIMLPTYSSTALIPPRTTLPAGASEEVAAATTSEAEGAPPACENPVHSVASGETLSQIAEQYGISMEEITALNVMIDPTFNPNLLSIGQQIVIPLCGVPTPTPSPTPTITPVSPRTVPEPIATATPLPPGVVRVQVVRVLNVGDVTSEAVEILNEGTSVARLEGWRLVNPRSGMEYVFPVLNLFPQGAITVHSGVGEDTAIDLYWGLDEAVWQVGDTVQLFNAEGELQVAFEIAAAP